MPEIVILSASTSAKNAKKCLHLAACTVCPKSKSNCPILTSVLILDEIKISLTSSEKLLDLFRITYSAVRDDVDRLTLGAVCCSVSPASSINCLEPNSLGESIIFATLSSPRPLRSKTLVVDACARTWPPTGLRPSAPAKRALAPGSD